MKTIHAGHVSSSPRLQRVLDLLRKRGDQGATTLEIFEQAKVCAVNSCVAELRANGLTIHCEREAKDRFRYRLRGEGAFDSHSLTEARREGSVVQLHGSRLEEPNGPAGPADKASAESDAGAIQPSLSFPRWRKRGIAVNHEYPKTIFDCVDGRTVYRYIPAFDEKTLEACLKSLNETDQLPQ